MSLRLGDIAPDFEQDSSEGRIRLHEWLGDSWGVLFSHPADFTPVCTTELGFTAKLKKAITTTPMAADSMGDQLPTNDSRADHLPRTAGGINSVNEA